VTCPRCLKPAVNSEHRALSLFGEVKLCWFVINHGEHRTVCVVACNRKPHELRGAA